MDEPPPHPPSGALLNKTVSAQSPHNDFTVCCPNIMVIQ